MELGSPARRDSAALSREDRAFARITRPQSQTVDEQELGRRQVLCSEDIASPANLTADDSRVTRVNVRGEEFQDTLDRIEAHKMFSSIDVLVKLARNNPPPQEWWDKDFSGL